MAEETVNINPDGSQTFEGGEDATMPPAAEEGFAEEAADAVPEEIATDPAIYLLIVVALFMVGFIIYRRRSKNDEDDFFSNLDGEKVSRHRCKSVGLSFFRVHSN